MEQKTDTAVPLVTDNLLEAITATKEVDGNALIWTFCADRRVFVQTDLFVQSQPHPRLGA